MTNTDTGVTRDTKTSELGSYTVSLLSPGNYQMVAEKQGLRSLEQTGIQLIGHQ